ncbi:hypothetical protein [uncultured Tateyamaria sp.]|uniref:hypothetical protein n=1 Tax=uncultured Tateyamaria sp. TaxID=455651 RepID=UPI00344E5910
MRDFNDALDRVQALGVQVVAYTSQAGNQSKANNDLKFHVVVDEDNTEALRHDIFITPQAENPVKAGMPELYPNGMVQPGIVIEDSKGRVLYRWAIVPSEMNIGGAKDRPLVSEIVGALGQILAGDDIPDGFKIMQMDHLETHHPDMHEKVLDHFAMMEKQDA